MTRTNLEIDLPAKNDGPSIIVDNGNVIAIPTPMDLLNRAVTSGATVEVLQGLMALQERWEASQARKAFDNAMVLAKSELPRITKNREVDFTSQKGRTSYRYEDLAGLAAAVDPVLARHGLSYRYKVSTETSGYVTVSCIISHRDGHTETSPPLTAPFDLSGNKNAIQAVGSSVTYLQRYALKAALGLAVSNDDDARSAGDTGEVISTKQVQDLMVMIENTRTDTKKFLAYIGAPSIQDIRVAQYDRAVAALNKKKAKVGRR